MTVAELTVPTTGLMHASTGAGTSAEADELRDWARQVQEAFSPSVTLGQDREAMLALVDLYGETCRDNWDGYGAKAVSPETYENARLLLDLLPTTVPPPDLSADPDGEISFEWYRSPRHVFSISISPKRRLTYAGIFGLADTSGTEYLLDEIPDEISDNIVRLLRSRR